MYDIKNVYTKKLAKETERQGDQIGRIFHLLGDCLL
jgi:hypothetical protein